VSSNQSAKQPGIDSQAELLITIEDRLVISDVGSKLKWLLEYASRFLKKRAHFRFFFRFRIFWFDLRLILRNRSFAFTRARIFWRYSRFVLGHGFFGRANIFRLWFVRSHFATG
jgi:hypothetical protein